MSRDFTPKEAYAFSVWMEENHHESYWDTIRSLRQSDAETGASMPVYTEYEIQIMQKCPILGMLFPFYFDVFNEEYGLQVMSEIDEKLSAYINTGTGDTNAFYIKWYEGKLDKSFYYAERNNQLMLEELEREIDERRAMYESE